MTKKLIVLFALVSPLAASTDVETKWRGGLPFGEGSLVSAKALLPIAKPPAGSPITQKLSQQTAEKLNAYQPERQQNQRLNLSNSDREYLAFGSAVVGAGTIFGGLLGLGIATMNSTALWKGVLWGAGIGFAGSLLLIFLAATHPS